MSLFSLKLLPASDGDCLILSWSDGGPLKHMVVDGGRAGTYPYLKKQFVRMAENGEELELYVLTHIDADHISGALSYLKDSRRPIAPKDVWFNGYRQIKGEGRRSMQQGDAYSAALAKLGWPLNRHFSGGVASIETAPNPIEVAGLKLSILSPDSTRLKAMGERWTRWYRKQDTEGKAATREGTRASANRNKEPLPNPLVVEDLVVDTDIDSEVPNGTSIAFVAEWQGRRVLFGGDAHPDLLVNSLGPLADAEGGRYRVDLLKAPHHGSTKNISRELVERIDCRHIVLSTNGNIHSHPDPQAIAKFIHFGSQGRKVLHFNYDTDRTRPWDNATAKQRYDYEARYPTGTPGMIEIDVMACQ
ncbi:hypothetical protein JQV27_13265 [Sulfitobacter mediterraneus]|uniref:ComEC/Rec2 family competence protein n=1 Tax=Sulfitobacter mediterraneus TaxID=83219 RepID=UPI001933E1CD|nr:MBL fold metallo-hydrolase [Sulfitobacter mediterraneus]MBM1633882.1 hypothetical protein [Sulfitobacter mediterraneus]MBM1641603.1 hypothetical protein [Sulfitobacter mediterraneus]MBM1645746.1 hypothetical protein [Sulfitobacter mediterraneus]MBM1649722.1 hypothetical protein [Sulfitobacter mediterraneus]MBM1653815.1 hypothetical protein [Sulfitobacter mediterraneus]